MVVQGTKNAIPLLQLALVCHNPSEYGAAIATLEEAENAFLHDLSA
jgi:hypothetical protein